MEGRRCIYDRTDVMRTKTSENLSPPTAQQTECTLLAIHFLDIRLSNMSMTYNESDPKPQPRPTPQVPDSVFAQFSMKGKVAVVTGAGSGIGLAAVEALAEAGADVAMWYNSNAKTIETAKGIAERYAVKAKAYKVQVAEWEQVHAAVQQVVSDLGRLDVFIANAGVAKGEGILEQSLEDWKFQVDVNCGYDRGTGQVHRHT